MRKQRLQLATGIAVHFLEHGAPAGEPVLMLHGYTDSSRSMCGTAEHLARLRPDLRLIIPDQRGHGLSSLPSPEDYRETPELAFTIGMFAADAVALLDALGVQRAHLIGHSLGSFVSQDLALSCPERVASVVLIASAAHAVANSAIEQAVLGDTIERLWAPALELRGHAYPEGVYELTPRDADANVERWLLDNWVVEPLADPKLLAAIAQETARVPLGTWIGVARAVLGFDHRERLLELSRPMLSLTAKKDPILPEEPEQRELHEALQLAAARGTKIVERQYDGELGHNFQWAIAERIARDIATFYGELRLSA